SFRTRRGIAAPCAGIRGGAREKSRSASPLRPQRRWFSVVDDSARKSRYRAHTGAMRPALNDVDQGGFEQVSTVDRVASLNGVRTVAALLVMGTHAAYGTGTTTHGYVGLIYARMDIGVAVFFVLWVFLLLGPWVRAAATGAEPPSVRRYARNRLRRLMPAYLVT